MANKRDNGFFFIFMLSCMVKEMYRLQEVKSLSSLPAGFRSHAGLPNMYGRLSVSSRHLGDFFPP